jgi:hypothetical protein
MTDLYVRQFNEFLDATTEERDSSRLVRDYLDNKQWTSREAAILKARGQAPIVKNIMRRKHDTLMGVERQRRSDPKALPRTRNHEGAAAAITKAIRFVVDNNDFDQLASDVFDEVLGEGYAGCITEIEKNGKGEPEIKLNRLHWDRVYFDPHSRQKNFKDKDYSGVTTWMKRSAIIKTWPDSEDDIKLMTSEGITDTDFEDRPRWIDRKTSDVRIRVNQHYFLKDSVWHLVYFTQGIILQKAKPSPVLDEFDEPENPMELECSYVGRNNERWGLDKLMIGPQDEVNHRTSKALHYLSSATIVTEKGAIASATQTLADVISGQALIELENPDARFDVDRGNADLAQGQMVMLQEAKEYLNDFGPNEAIAGKEARALSGRALLQREQSGLTEIAHIYDSHSDFKIRVFRQIANRIKQFWTEEKTFRVTDDEKSMKFISLNRPITEREKMSKQFGVPAEGLDQALADNGIQAIGDLDQPSDEIENSVAEMDVDIILTESPNIAILQDEQFEIISQLAQSRPEIPIEAVIQSSNITNKEEVLELIQGDEGQREQLLQQQQQQAQAQAQQDQQNAQADNATKVAKARKDNADADGQISENQIVQLQLGLESA